MRLRWYAGPSLILLGLLLLTLVGCAPAREGWPHEPVEPPLDVGCLYRVGVEPVCWGCRYNAWRDDLYCDRVVVGPELEWRL